MDKIVQIVTTGDSRDLMEKIGKNIVEKRLASCAQISGPIKSTYWWKGKIAEATEWVCTLKTTSGLYAKVEATIRELHPYELPEIIAIHVERALPEYEDWVREETSKPNRGERT
jgi:periplasmic divalent cation tolerance protein